jgi:hypothetical protein
MKPKMTKHMKEDLLDRYVNIAITLGIGEELASFPRENEMGPTIHTVTSTGIIFVKSVRTSQIITCWVASPSQIYKLYGDKKPPISLINKAKKNQQKGYLKLN